MFWEQMGIENKSVEYAFKYIQSYGTAQTRRSLFWLDQEFNYGDENDNLRIYGLGGGVRLKYIKLDNN
jgi:hypothetical protein